ncbi:MAG: M20/M25/M40 family metallo-hydrolase [Chthoniobacterales bacterium]
MTAEDLVAAAERRLPDTLDLLERLVRENSFTTNAEGVRKNAEIVAAAFAPLGFEAEFVPAKDPAHGPHLILRRGSEASSAPTVALISHLDTVFPAEEEVRNDFRWRREGDRITGPGTNDIKGGTALIYQLTGVLGEVDPTTWGGVNWVLLFNACEEVDSEDFGRLCHRVLPRETRACLIFEADGGDRSQPVIVASRKGRATFRIEVSGIAAHAGGGHAFGANAIVELGRLVEAVSAITDYDAGVTVNVGHIEGGTVTNRVPHAASARLEMRALDPESYENAKQQILGFAGPGEVRTRDGNGYPCEVSISIGDEMAPWPRNDATAALIELWKRAGEELGVRVLEVDRGGLSDGNVLWESFPTLDGLGPNGDACHCSERSPDGSKEQEWVDAASFVPKTVLNALAIRRLLVPKDAD